MGLGSIIAALSITASATSPASAQVGLGAVAAFCGPKQAFGIPFGSREAPGIHMSFVSSLIPLDAAYSPFNNAEVMVTLIGRRRHTIHAQADFASESRAQDALATVRATLLAQGWIESERAEGKATTSLYSDLRARDEKHPSGRIAELFTLGSRLYFGCSDAAWKRRADHEMPPRSAPATAAR